MLLRGNYAHTPSLAPGHRNHSADGRPSHPPHTLLSAWMWGQRTDECAHCPACRPLPVASSSTQHIWIWREQSLGGTRVEKQGLMHFEKKGSQGKEQQGSASRTYAVLREESLSAQGKWPSRSSCQSGLLREEAGTLASVARQPMSGQMSWKEQPTREASKHH